MSTPRHHTEWLSLVEVSGPFLSLPVLLRVFPQGLDAHDPEHARSLRMAFAEWRDNQNSPKPSAAVHDAWIRFVLTQTLSLDERVLAEGQAIPQSLRVVVAEHGETLRPDLIVRSPEGDPDAGKVRLLVQTYPSDQDLRKPVRGRRWKEWPESRMADLLHASGVRLGLVTNGEHWMLVDAPRGETTGFASWYATLWLEEPVTLRAFRSLLGLRRFFGVSESDTLEAMLAESTTNQQDVTDQLGYQVRKAVEVLIRSLDRADQDHGRALLAEVPPERLYEAALTVMMRLVFLFSAEERGLLRLGDSLYDQHYAVSTLRAQLREAADQHGEEVLERRLDAWCRLLGTFRAVYGGIDHDRLALPAYGGHLFDPDRFPFLEGRPEGTSWRTSPDPASPPVPLPIDNRTVLHLLEALQVLQVKVPGGGPPEARRLSFKALDVTQIGHVYEGLLDHTARRANGPVLGLVGSKDQEPEVPLADLERLRDKGDEELVKALKEMTGRSPSALQKALAQEIDGLDADRLHAACSNDEDLYQRVKPFAGLVRHDTFGYPMVIRRGSVYVTEGSDRRSSGTHYTPRSLTEPIVRHTLDPLVYHGPAEGLPPEKWTLRNAGELLDLKVCDMACGSGAFLVEADRYLADRLLEAWDVALKEHPDVPGITPEGRASTGRPDEALIPADEGERLTFARRIVAQRCLYGVDKNRLAAEMAKLSLWLFTLAKDKPFTFLDHAIRPGDSLVGVSTEQLKTFSLDGKGIGITLPNFLDMIPKIMEATRLLRVRLERIADEKIADVEEKERLFANIRFQTKRLNYAADRLMAVYWSTAKPAERSVALRKMLEEVDHLIRDADPDVLESEARIERQAAGCPQPFHWPLEFPEVFQRGARSGFDAFVGNPPFLGGIRIRSTLGEDYLRFLQTFWGGGNRADLCAYFFRRTKSLARQDGMIGLLATNTIAQGDTREFGLERIVQEGAAIIRAVASRAWPGTASLEVAHVWLSLGPYKGQACLDDRPVAGVTSFLTPATEVSGTPYRLAANIGRSFKGSDPLGIGFIIEEREARDLIERNPRNAEVVQPFLNGEDLNSRPDQSASRWTIHFRNWPLDRQAAPDGYDGPVAADYPECLAILEERVKPVRQRTKPNGEFVLRKPLPQKWWIYNCPRPELYRTIQGLERVLVRPEVSNTHAMVFVGTDVVFANLLCIFPLDSWSSLSVMQSNFHENWARFHSSSMRTDMRYTTADCFDTFPFPSSEDDLHDVGKTYHDHRRQIMLARQEGLTKTYNRFHDPDESSADILRLRDLHFEIDRAVAGAYGWSDLDLGHGFHQTKQGLRYTISESARGEVLARLLRLNHERYAEEVAKSLHGKKAKASTGKRGKAKVVSESRGLFDEEAD